MTRASAAGALQAPDRGLARVELARAKVNLTLEIRGKRADGYHELESLVLFADFGDRLEYRAGEPFSFTIEGPFAAGLETGGNLVERAAFAYAQQHGSSEPSGAFRLIKNIPVAAGLGGGSADAAAAFRLLAAARGAGDSLDALLPAARSIGADVPCCLFSRAAIMTGIGEVLHPLAPIAPLPAVLVNPMLPLATRDVFAALEAAPLTEAPPAPHLPKLAGIPDVVAYARQRVNHLESPARRLLPVIGDILAVLDAAPGALLARLSGSGPTCYGIFTNHDDANAAAASIGQEYPGWWVQPVILS